MVKYNGQRIDWAAAKAEYVNNATMTYAQIAVKYGVKQGTVQNQAARNNWTDSRAKRNEILLQNLTQKTVATAAQELAKYNEQDLIVAKALRSMVYRKMQDAQKLSKSKNGEELPLSLDAKEIRSLAGAVESAQRIARLALGASTENKGEVALPFGEFDWELLSDEEFAALKQSLVKGFNGSNRGNPTTGGSAIQ